MHFKRLIPFRIVLLTRKLRVFYKKISKHNIRKKKKISILHIHLTDHCNLNCRGCDNFSPLSPEVFADVITVENDLKRISVLCYERVKEIQLLGGEPLLHEKVIDFLYITRKYFPNTPIKLVSNGVLLNRQNNEFWDACRQNDIEIVVTKYPIKINHDDFKQLAFSKNVKFSFYGSTEDIEKTMMCIPLDVSGNQNIRDSFLRCSSANRCIALDNGKLYTCTTIPYIKYFNNYFNKNLEVSKKDYLDIYKAESFNEILKFLRTPPPFCRYCNQKDIIWDIGFGISNKKIEEWTG